MGQRGRHGTRGDERGLITDSRHSPDEVERNFVTKQQQHWPTWIVVVSIIILTPPLVWALSSAMHIIAALSIGGIVAIVAMVALIVWLKNRAEA